MLNILHYLDRIQNYM